MIHISLNEELKSLMFILGKESWESWFDQIFILLK